MSVPGSTPVIACLFSLTPAVCIWQITSARLQHWLWTHSTGCFFLIIYGYTLD